MTAVITSSPSGPDTVLDPADFGDGPLPRFELIYAGGTLRAYADEPVDLIDAIVPGYATMNETDQWRARLHLAVSAQVAVQAEVNTSPSFATCPPPERLILSGPRHEPPVVPSWDCPVPLVLVSTYYAPAGGCPAPQPVNGMPANVLWIDPSDDLALLMTLNDLDVVALNEATEPAPPVLDVPGE